MNYDEATQITEEMLEQASELAEHNRLQKPEAYPFIVGCLMAEIRMLLMGDSRYSQKK